MTFVQAQPLEDRRVINPNLDLIPNLIGIFGDQILIRAAKTCHA